jgi:hypothetical protein
VLAARRPGFGDADVVWRLGALTTTGGRSRLAAPPACWALASFARRPRKTIEADAKKNPGECKRDVIC